MKNSRRILSVVICLVLFASLAQAKKFSDPPAGQGVSTVGTIPGSDYATLAQAAADFNGLAGGCTGDWTLLINSDLTEPANVPFGNSTNGYMVTMRPAPGVDPVVSMTAATVGTVPGHLIIGAGAANSFGALIKTDNFTINGCSDDAFSTRSLTFINNNAAIVNSRLILVVGDSDNVTIKNCHITNRSTRDTALSCVGVEFLSRTDGVNDFIPDNGTVQNCAITARGASSGTGRYGTGVKQTNSGIITSGRAQTGFKVMDCDIQARYVGVFLGQTAGATVSNNRIRLNQYYPTQQIYGIYHVNANGASGWTMNISGNRIDELVNVSAGTTAIHLGNAAYDSAHNAITFNVYNNMICGFSFTTAQPASNVVYRGIHCEYGSSISYTIALNFHYNSIYMPHFENLTYLPGDRASQRSVFAMGSPDQYRGRIFNFHNNNIRVEQAYASCIHFMRYYYNAIVSSDYNNLSTDRDKHVIVGRYDTFYELYEYSTVEAWRESMARSDLNSVSLNPLVPHSPFTGTWTAVNNLLFTAYPSPMMAAAPVAGITTDIKGAPRHPVVPLMGCDEQEALSSAKIVLLSNVLDFGKRKIISNNGSSVSRKIKYRNVGAEPLTLTSGILLEGSTEFTFVSLQSPVNQGAFGECTIRYTPETLGLTTGTVRLFTGNDPYDAYVDFQARGTGALPQVSVGDTTGTDWGYCFVGSTQGTRKIRIGNIGEVDLLVTGIEISGDPDISVVYVPNTPFVLPSFGFNETVTLEYTPLSRGPHQKTITVYTDDYPNSPKRITFRGTGIDVVVEEDPFFSGYAKTLSVGGTGIMRDLRVMNDTQNPTTYTIAISDPHFTAADSHLVLDPFSTGVFKIRYLPTAVEDNTAIYQMTSSTSGYPVITGTLLGRGWTQTQGRRVFMDGAFGGTVQVDSAGTYTRTRLVVPPGTFTGIQEIRVQEPSTPFGRKNAIEVRTYPEVYFPIPATLYVEFLESDMNALGPAVFTDIGVGRWWGGWRLMPDTMGTASVIQPGRYEIAYKNLWNLSAPYVYSIISAGISLRPTSLNFGKAVILSQGGVPLTDVITIRNLGPADLNISSIDRVAGSSEFTIDSFDATIAPGASGLCVVRYTPVSVGAALGRFRVTSNDPLEPSKDFIVQGTGRWTKKFSEAPEGRGQSMVGNTPEADYLTLAEAAADFNGFAGGCTGNWTLWIASDLTEQASVAFGNSVPAPYRVTVRPLPGISPSVLFTQNTVPAIPGHLIIGATDPGDPSSLVKTDRFFINGCSDDSFSTKNLTILNRDDIQIDDSRLVVVIGDSDNFTIKNSILFNRSLSNAENGCIAMDFMSRNDGIISYIPDESSVENCVINALGGSPVTGRFGIGVRQSGLGAIPSGEAQTDLAVNDCEINARYAGILLGQTAGGSIHGNTIRLDQFAADTHIRGIWLQSAHATSGWSLDISGNRIDKLINVDTGITAIDLGGETYADKHDSIWFNVYNNMICGFNFTSGSPVPNVYYRGIRYDGGSDFVVPIHFNCYYNSLYLPHFDNLSYTAGDETSRRAAFAIGGPLSQSSRLMDIRNNIVRVEQYYAAAIHYMDYLDKTLFSSGFNDLSADTTSGAFTGRYSAFNSIIEYSTLEDWRNAPYSPDLTSVSLDPFAAVPPYTGIWTSPDNLLFTSYHSESLIGTPIGGITTDIKGVTRHPQQPYMGCDEHLREGMPWAAITVSPSGILTDGIPVSFKIYSLAEAPCTIMVEYSVNDGTSWTPVSSLAGLAAGLASGPNGVEHSIVWNSIPDIGTVDVSCILRITVRKDATPGEWGSPSAVTDSFFVRNATFLPVKSYSLPADEGWARSYADFADGHFFDAVDGAFYVASHSTSSGLVSITAGSSPTDNRSYAGGWQCPNSDIPYVAGNVYLAKFKVSSTQTGAASVPNSRLYFEFINSAGAIAAAGGTRVGKGPFAPDAAGRTYNVIVEGAPDMSPEIQNIRLKFEVIDFDPNEWGANTLHDVDVYRFDAGAFNPSVKIATFSPPFSGWTGRSLGSPFGNATLGSNTTGLWIETPGPTAGPGRTVDYAFWQLTAASSGLVYAEDKLYRSVWTVSVPDAAAENTCARVRMIMSNQANNWGAEFVADPGAGYREQMPKVGGTEYSVWQETLPLLYSGTDAALNKMGLLFDVADGREDQSGRISLEKVELYYYDIP